MTQWHSLKKVPPPVGKKIIALHSDGSGASMFFRHDGGYIDCEGDECSTLSAMYDVWAELPQNFEFWCETRSEDPMTFSAVTPADGGAPFTTCIMIVEEECRLDKKPDESWHPYVLGGYDVGTAIVDRIKCAQRYSDEKTLEREKDKL